MNQFRIYLITSRAPQIMSLVALAICAVGWSGIVRHPPGDEGALAHLYRLLMVGQIPLIAAFLFTAVRRGFRQGLPVFGLQACCGFQRWQRCRSLAYGVRATTIRGGLRFANPPYSYALLPPHRRRCRPRARSRRIIGGIPTRNGEGAHGRDRNARRR